MRIVSESADKTKQDGPVSNVKVQDIAYGRLRSPDMDVWLSPSKSHRPRADMVVPFVAVPDQRVKPNVTALRAAKTRPEPNRIADHQRPGEMETGTD